MTKKNSSESNAVSVQFSLSKQAIIIIAFPFILHIVFLLKYGELVQHIEKLAKQEYYSKALINHGNWAVILLSVAANSVLGYTLTGDKQFKQLLENCLESLPKAVSETYDYLPVDSTQNKSVRSLQEASVNASQLLKQLENKGGDKYKNKISVLNGLVDAKALTIWRKVYEARHELLQFNRVRGPNDSEALPEARQTLKTFLNVGLALDLVLAAFLIYAFNRLIGLKLSVLTENSRRLAAGDKLVPRLIGNDEIALLDEVLHNSAYELERSRKRLQESEDRVRKIIENMPVGLMTLDESGALETLNKAGKEIIGKQDDSIDGKPLQEILPLIKELPTDGANQYREVEAQRNGKSLFLEVNRTEYPTTEGKLVLVSMHDVTMRRELEQTRQEFLNMVSHDLRTPLTSVQFFHGLLAKGVYGELNESGKDSLDGVKRSIERLVQMINDLLDFEKLQALESITNLEPVRVQKIIDAAVETVLGFSQSCGVKVEVVETNFYVMGDQTRLTQVIINLLSNALKFSPRSGTVLVDTISIPGFIELRVIDEGPGVRTEDRTRIFQKYKQARKSDAVEKGGIGLGLPICKMIVEQHGGLIGVESEEQKGSTFWIRLPKADENGSH